MLAETDEQEQVQETIGSEQESESADQATARRKKQQRRRKKGKAGGIQLSHLAEGE